MFSRLATLSACCALIGTDAAAAKMTAAAPQRTALGRYFQWLDDACSPAGSAARRILAASPAVTPSNNQKLADGASISNGCPPSHVSTKARTPEMTPVFN